MNRRAFIQSLTAALVAAGLPTPPASLESLLPEQVTGETLIPNLLEPQFFRIGFPDGTAFDFQGVVVARVDEVAEDGLNTVSLSVKPIGSMTQSLRVEADVSRVEGVPTQGTTLSVARGEVHVSGATEFAPIAEVLDVAPPNDMADATWGDDHVLGIRRSEPLQITVNFKKN